MAKKKNDQEILALLKDSIQSGVNFLDSKLAKERQQVMDYYQGKLPRPVHAGNSKYVSTDVFDTIESMKATILETFSAGSDIVEFSPDGEQDVDLARVSTAYTQHVIFELNCGTSVFASVIHDGLTARLGVAKVYWDEKYEEIEETFEDLPEVAVAQLLEDPNVEIQELEEYALPPMAEALYSGSLVRREDCSQIRIEAIPAEEFVINPNVKELAESDVTHRTEKTKSDLIKEGYDEKLVAKISTGKDNTLEMNEERITRFDHTGSSGFGRMSGGRENGDEVFVIYETYASMDLDGSGKSKLWKIVHDNGNVILDRQQVDRVPFITFSPLPVPHSLYGGNLGAKVIPIQNAKTVLTRSILDHAVVANNPRYGVVRGALTNPRELLDNRLGGLVNVTRSDGIFPLPQAPLNPFVFQTIEMLDSDKEDATGVSRLSQGLNKDAISKQNSQGMVEQLIGASMQRQKIIAREFATQFLKPLFVEVYRLAVENEKAERIVEIAGSFIPVRPYEWKKLRHVRVDLRLGYGEKERQAQELLQLNQVLASDPTVAHLYTPEHRYRLYKSVWETKGYKQPFLADPKTAQPPQPDPMQVAEVQKVQKEVEIMDRRMALEEQKAKANYDLEQMRQDMDNRFSTLEFMLKSRDAERKDAETENRIEVSKTEMELARETAENPAVEPKANAIISPNG